MLLRCVSLLLTFLESLNTEILGIQCNYNVKELSDEERQQCVAFNMSVLFRGSTTEITLVLVVIS